MWEKCILWLSDNSNMTHKSEYSIPELFGDVPVNKVFAFIV